MAWKWLGAAAVIALAAGSVGAAEVVRTQAPGGEEAPHPVPIEPILVQGYVKEMNAEQLTLTAPGAPVDLPLELVDETRFIQGEDDVERASVHEGQLVRAALLPMGEDLVALVVEVVPEEPMAPEQDPNLQGETPPAQPAVPEADGNGEPTRL